MVNPILFFIGGNFCGKFNVNPFFNRHFLFLPFLDASRGQEGRESFVRWNQSYPAVNYQRVSPCNTLFCSCPRRRCSDVTNVPVGAIVDLCNFQKKTTPSAVVWTTIN